MARSPLRAGVGCANPASQPQFYRPRPHGRGYRVGRDAWPHGSTFLTQARRRRVKVGRAVHCAPGLVMQTQLLGWNPAVRALTGAGTARAPVGCKKP